MKSIPSLALSSAFLALLGTSAGAAITYIDAAEGSSGNTFATGGSLATTTWVGAADSAANETQWSKRDFGNGPSIFQARHSLSPDDMPELTTRITGLTDGSQYDVWVFFWDASGANTWNIAAGLTSGSLTTYSFDGSGDTSSAVATSTLSFTTAVTTTEPTDRIMYGVNLGPVTASGTTINVFVDNLTGGDSANRTWYDGVGYEVIPEPSAALLGGLGALLLLRRRR